MMTNFAEMTDAEINRWAAERDGFLPSEWYISRDNGKSGCVFCDTKYEAEQWFSEHLKRVPNSYMKDAQIYEIKKTRPYASSADAALTLCERWGLEIADCLQRGSDFRIRLFVNPIGNPPQRAHHGPTFPRALTNAACAAKEAMDYERNDDE